MKIIETDLDVTQTPIQLELVFTQVSPEVPLEQGLSCLHTAGQDHVRIVVS